MRRRSRYWHIINARYRPFGMPRVRYSDKVALHVDPLRDQKTPSVSELVARRVDQLVSSPLVGVAGFRRLLLRTLEDRSEFGTAGLKDGSVVYHIKNGASSGGGWGYIDADGPRSTREVPMRVCDYYGWKLTAALDGIPACMPFWSEDRRDRALAGQITFVKQYGERFDASPLYDQVPDRLTANRLPPVFPPLDHPATADEVRRGLAIFSIGGSAPVRVVRLPALPLTASWVKLTDYAFQQQFAETKTGESGIRVAYDQDGLVWQVEEVLEEGRRRRYYGFAGRRLDRVAAEEIEFP